MMYKLICLRCSKEFFYHYKRRFYCDECREEIKKERKRKERRRWKNTIGGKAATKRHRKRRKKNGCSRGDRKQQTKRCINELKTSYLKVLISETTGLHYSFIPNKIVQIKRQQLKALRLYRKARKELGL